MLSMDHEQTHYAVLGLKPTANHTDIGIAYRRLMGKRRAEHMPPDPRGDALIEEAFKVLGEPDSREYYDAELQAQMLARPVSKLRVAGLAAALFAVAGGAWFFL